MKAIEAMSDSTATIEVSTTGEVTNATSKGNGSENLTIPKPPFPPPPLPPPNPEAGGKPPEHIHWPENIDKLEVVKSPEFALFGEFLVQEIIRLEGMPYDVRYMVNGNETGNEIITFTPIEKGYYLDRLYADLRKYVGIISKYRNDQVSPQEEKLYETQAKREIQQIVEQTSGEGVPAPEYQPNTLGRISDLLSRYQSGERGEVETKLFIYLKEASRRGLLKDAEDELVETYKAIKAILIPPGQSVENFINQRIQAVTNAAIGTFVKLSENRPDELRPLAGIGEFYALLARQRLEKMIRGLESPPVRETEGEWNPEKTGREENYWQNSPSYPEYYNVSARTQEQFIRAKETFLQMIKLKGLGLAPETVFTHLQNFRKTFGTQAGKMAGEGNISPDFAVNIRLELEGLSFLWGANYANEVYNPEQYKQFMTELALHEGPQRWVRVARSGDGLVAAHSWKWDKDPRLNLYHNPCGSRGQIANDTLAQNYLQSQIKKIMIEKGAGIIFKDSSKLDRIGIHQSDESFKALYDGFDNGNAHIADFEKYATRLLADGTHILFSAEQLNAIYKNPNLAADLKRSIRIGKVQFLINELRNRVRSGKRAFTNIDQEIITKDETKDEKKLGRLREMNLGNPNEGITKEEEDAYKDALAKSDDSFDVAFQMVGVSAEKVRRGGGVFYVDRNIYVQAYERLQHIDNKYLNEEQLKAKRIGRILWSLRTPGAKLNNSTKDLNDDLTDQEFYDKLSTIEKTDYVDHMPVYMAEKFVQFAENWTKMKYGDDCPIWDQPGFKERVRDIPNFRAKYRAAMMYEARTRAQEQIKRNGFQAMLQDADYDFTFIDKKLLKDIKEEKILNPKTGKPIRLPVYINAKKVDDKARNFRAMTIKTPKGEIDPQTGKMRVTKMDEDPADFQTTQEHWLSRWTSHTYWFYQQENRHMILASHVFEDAEKIKKGELREKDANPLAVFLLILDPSLKRVRKVPDNQEQEIEMMGAAVEESYQSHWRINRNLHRLFLPVDGNPHRMRMGYNREDYGGASRFSVRCRDLMASQPRRFARRMAALIADMPMEITSMPDIWGADGIMGAVNMMADKINDIADQRIASQFALTKFNDQMGYGWSLFEALVGKVNGREVVDEEGLNEKPTNNSDKLQAWRQKGFDVTAFPERENELLYAFKDSFGRLERVLKIMRVMMSSVRNAQGILWLEEKDIYLPDGDTYNPEHADDKNNGTSRHSEGIFYKTYIKWLMSKGPGGGVQAYPDDAPIYTWLYNILLTDKYDNEKKRKNARRTLADWLFEKMGR